MSAADDRAFVTRIRAAVIRGARIAWLALRVALQSASRPKVRERARYARRYRNLMVAPRTVLFEATLDDAIRCNPRALFLHMLVDPAFSDRTLVWAIRNPRTLKALRREYRDRLNVAFVKRDSNAHMRYLSSAGHVITNGSLPPYFERKDGQVVVNTWHGVPIKRMGFEIPNGNTEARNVLRVLVQTDYLLSGSEYETEALYLRSHKLQGIFRGSVIEEGHPRDDLTLDCDRTDHAAWLRTHGVDIGVGKKVVLYAPTWRGSRVFEAENTIDELYRFVTVLRAHLDPEEYTILLKLHQLTAVHLVDDARFADMLVPTGLDTNELLGVVDVLVTDYSSIFVDFLVTGRPVVFFIDDLEAYLEERGVYILQKDLPGPVAETPEQTAQVISRITDFTDEYADRYEHMRRTLCGREDGHATERVIDIVFNHATGHRVRTDFTHDKKTVLLGVGAFGDDHASRSMLALLGRIDYSRYDVSVLGPFSRTRSLSGNLLRMPDPVRPFLRVGGSNVTAMERVRMEYFVRFGAVPVLGWSGYPDAIFRREWRRCFGAVGFDVAIDLAGTMPKFSAIIAEGDCERSYIVDRHDVIATGKNRQTAALSISGRFTGRIAPPEALFSRMIEPEIVRADAAACDVERIGEDRVLVIPDERLADPPPPQRVLLPRVAARSFVSTTQDSAGKRLVLDAFARVLAHHPDATLAFIDRGVGADRLARTISELGLSSNVMVANPRVRLAYISNCGCFVTPPRADALASTLLEAAALGMPTIVADSEIAQGLFAGTGRLVSPDAEAIADAMCGFLEGRLVQGAVDFEAYNGAAILEFERLVDGVQGRS